MNKILHIHTLFDCLIKGEDIENYIKKGQLYAFSFSNDYVVLTIYPFEYGKKFDIVVDFKNLKIYCKNASLKLIDFQDNEFLITISYPCFSLPKAYSLNYKKLSFGGLHEIIYSSHDTFLLCLKNDCDKLILENNNFVGKMSFHALQNHLLFYAKTEKNTYLFGQIDYENKEYKKVIFQEFDIFEEKQNNITLIKNLCDFGHHSIKYTFNLKDFSTKKQLVADNDLQIATKKEIAQYAFVDAIKVEDFDLARKYLTEELSNKLDDLHLKSFFGKFIDIFQNIKKDANSNEIALFYKNKDIYQAKIYCFDYIDNKISNICEK